MSRTAHIGLLTMLMALSAGPASAIEHPRVPCSRLTVTIAHSADIPAGMSVRALQEGLNYPKRCR